jgi:hypothetical protein
MFFCVIRVEDSKCVALVARNATSKRNDDDGHSVTILGCVRQIYTNKSIVVTSGGNFKLEKSKILNFGTKGWLTGRELTLILFPDLISVRFVSFFMIYE